MLKDELWQALFAKLGSPNQVEQDYVFEYFIGHVQRAFDAPPPRLVSAIRAGLNANNDRFKALVEDWQIDSNFELRPLDHPWVDPFAASLARFESGLPSDDEVPF